MNTKPIEKALVVLSGGADSCISLYWAIAQWGKENVEALSFNYGQRHACELQSAATITKMAGIKKHTILPINTFGIMGGSALVGKGDVNGKDATNPALPASFVPGRNLIFLTFAAAYAYQQNILHLITGVAQADSSGYPDTRQNTLEALARALCLGMDHEIKIHAPLMFLSKAQSVHLAIELGAMEALAFTLTCYEGHHPMPCGMCPSCRLRARGFEEAGIADPLIVRALGGLQ